MTLNITLRRVTDRFLLAIGPLLTVTGGTLVGGLNPTLIGLQESQMRPVIMSMQSKAILPMAAAALNGMICQYGPSYASSMKRETDGLVLLQLRTLPITELTGPLLRVQ